MKLSLSFIAFGIVCCLLLFVTTPIAYSSLPGDERILLTPPPVDELDEATVVWSEDFEDPFDDWTFINLLAQEEHHWHSVPGGLTGERSWTCAESGIYGEKWLQWLMTPNLDLSSTTSPELTFSIQVDIADWADGAAVWVFYGEDESNLEAEQLPVSGTPYNNDHSLYSFDDVWYMPYSDGWSGTIETWSEVTADLSPYREAAIVRIAVVFGSDRDYESGFGVLLDDLRIHDGDTEIFFDGAENPDETELTVIGGNFLVSDPQIGRIELDSAPSLTHVFGSETQERGFIHGFVSAPFDLPVIEPDQHLYLEAQLNLEGTHTTGPSIYWSIDISTDGGAVWTPLQWVVSNLGLPPWPKYTDGWQSIAERMNDPYFADISPLAGEENVLLRYTVYMRPEVPLENFTHAYVDNLELIQADPPVDLELNEVFVPFPRSVGIPIAPRLTLTNNAFFSLTVPGISWDLGGEPMNGWPIGPFTLEQDETFTLQLDADPDDGFIGWLPDEPGEQTLTVSHNYSEDEIPENDSRSGQVTVLPEGVWELGYDGGLSEAVNMAYFQEGQVALVHIVPDSINETIALHPHRLTKINVQLQWFNQYYGDGNTVEFELGVLSGSTYPLELRYSSSPISFSDPDQGDDYSVSDITHEIPPELQLGFEPGEDYYLYMRPLSLEGLEEPALGYRPFIRVQRSSDIGPTSSSSIYNIELGELVNTTSFAYRLRTEVEALPLNRFTRVPQTSIQHQVVIDAMFSNGAPAGYEADIGILDGGVCVGTGRYFGGPVTITCFGEDSGAGLQGFRNGAPIEFRIYPHDSDTVLEGMIDELLAGDGTFGDFPQTEVTLQILEPETQSIDLAAPYNNMISLGVWPVDASAEAIFGSIDGLVAAYAGDGGLFVPDVINTIGEINLSQAYRLVVSTPITFESSGARVSDHQQVQLEGGMWEWVSYPYLETTPVSDALVEAAESLEIILADDGGLWIPTLSLNTLGVLRPGEGYMVFANGPTQFEYNLNPAKLASDLPPLVLAEPKDAPHPTGLPYTVLLKLDETLQEAGLATVEVLDGNRVAGKAFVRPDDEFTIVTAWQQTEKSGKQGFQQGHQIQVRLLDHHGSEVPSVISGEATRFGEGPYALLNLAGEPTLPEEFRVSAAWPNPFNPSTTIRVDLPYRAHLEIAVYNLLGERVSTLASRVYPAGNWPIVFDGSSLTSGIYFIQSTIPGRLSNTQKIVLIK